MEEERTRLQKIVLLALAVMIAAYGVLMVVSRFRKGVAFEEGLLRVETLPDATVYTGKAHGAPVTVTVSRESGSAVTVEFLIRASSGEIHDVCQVEYPLAEIQTESGEAVPGIRILKNGAVLFEGGYGGTDYSWYDRDGQWAPQFGVVTSGGSAAAPWAGYETGRGDIMYFAQGPELTARGSWGLYALMVFFSILVMLDAAFPLTMFRLQHCCDVRDPEPSDFYLFMQQVGWVLYPVLILIGYTVALRQLP